MERSVMKHASAVVAIVLLEIAIFPACFAGYNGGHGGRWRGNGGGFSSSFKEVGPSVVGSLGGHSGQGWTAGPKGSSGGWNAGARGSSGHGGGGYGDGWAAGPKGGAGYGGGEVWRPYHFGYQTQSHDATTSREEKTDQHGRVSGYYTLMTADGRNRKVSYVADEHGFRAKVDTNEPGTASEDPASVHFRSTAPKVEHPSGPQGSWQGNAGWTGGNGGAGHNGWKVSNNVNHGGWNGGAGQGSHGRW